jgi:hypothetical protein
LFDKYPSLLPFSFLSVIALDLADVLPLGPVFLKEFIFFNPAMILYFNIFSYISLTLLPSNFAAFYCLQNRQLDVRYFIQIF